MTADTLKSIGYLKKSLKMTRRAISKNMGADNTSDVELDDMTGKINGLLKLIEGWESEDKSANIDDDDPDLIPVNPINTSSALPNLTIQTITP